MMIKEWNYVLGKAENEHIGFQPTDMTANTDARIRGTLVKDFGNAFQRHACFPSCCFAIHPFCTLVMMGAPPVGCRMVIP